MSAQRSCAAGQLAGNISHRVRGDLGEADGMTEAPRPQPYLTTSRGAALYIGALLGPGLLLLPGLAAVQAGPASILAWLGLVCLSGLFAAVFSALGRTVPSAGGVTGYVTAGLGARAGLVTGWSFLTAVVCGAPVVCLIGASYVTGPAGGRVLSRAVVAAVLLLIVLALAARGLRASATAQLVLVSLLIGVVVVAVLGSAGSAHLANWTPFAPHGWLSAGHAATTLMLSFVGWEAVAPLTTRFANPSRQLPRVIGLALAATTALYLSLAIATIGVLGPGAATAVPLADLLSRAIGPAGPAVAAVAAIVLTLGTTNAYITGAATMARELLHGSRTAAARELLHVPRATAAREPVHVPRATRRHGFLARKPSQEGHGTRENREVEVSSPDRRGQEPQSRFLGAIAAAGLLLITSYGAGLVSTAWLVTVPTTLFLAVYLTAMAAAVVVLRGKARAAAIPAAIAVVVMLAFCGWLLAVPAVVAVAVVACARCAGHSRRAGPPARAVPVSRAVRAPARRVYSSEHAEDRHGRPGRPGPAPRLRPAATSREPGNDAA
jgi:amino acid efflux transporter